MGWIREPERHKVQFPGGEDRRGDREATDPCASCEQWGLVLVEGQDPPQQAHLNRWGSLSEAV